VHKTDFLWVNFNFLCIIKKLVLRFERVDFVGRQRLYVNARRFLPHWQPELQIGIGGFIYGQTTQ